MNQWAFVASAYALTFLGTFALCLSCWRAMRDAETAAKKLADRS